MYYWQFLRCNYFFKTRLDGQKVQSIFPRESVASYENTCIEKERIIPVPGTIYFHSNSLDVLNLKKNIIYAIAGTFIIVGVLGLAGIYDSYDRHTNLNPAGGIGYR